MDALPACDKKDGLLFGAEDPVGASHASVEQARLLVELTRVLPPGSAGVVLGAGADAKRQGQLRAARGEDDSQLGAVAALAVGQGLGLGAAAGATLRAMAGAAPPLDAPSFCSLALALGRAGLSHEIGRLVEAAEGTGSPALGTANGTAQAVSMGLAAAGAAEASAAVWSDSRFEVDPAVVPRAASSDPLCPALRQALREAMDARRRRGESTAGLAGHDDGGAAGTGGAGSGRGSAVRRSLEALARDGGEHEEEEEEEGGKPGTSSS